MKLNRRDFLQYSALGASSIILSSCFKTAPKNGLILAPEVDMPGRKYSLGVYDFIKQTYNFVELSHEGHSVVPLDNSFQKVIICGQRPTKKSSLVDVKNRKVLKVFDSIKDHYFYGHGLISKDGKYLYSTENHDQTGEGKIVLRSLPDLKVIKSIPSMGHSPHELKYLSSGKIAVANSGLQGAAKKSQKNLDKSIEVSTDDYQAMKSSVIILDPTSFNIEKQYYIDKEFISIRHMDVDSKDNIFLALKTYKSKIEDIAPIAIIKKAAKSIEFFKADSATNKSLDNFSLSICVHDEQKIVGLTSPASHAVSFWSSKDLTHIKTIKIPKPAGVTLSPEKDMFIVANDFGDIQQFDVNTLRQIKGNKAIKGLNGSHLLSSHNA